MYGVHVPVHGSAGWRVMNPRKRSFGLTLAFSHNSFRAFSGYRRAQNTVGDCAYKSKRGPDQELGGRTRRRGQDQHVSSRRQCLFAELVLPDSALAMPTSPTSTACLIARSSSVASLEAFSRCVMTLVCDGSCRDVVRGSYFMPQTTKRRCR